MYIIFTYENIIFSADVGHYDSSRLNNFGGHPDLMEEEWSEITFDKLVVDDQDIMPVWDLLDVAHREGIEAAAWSAIEKEEAEL